MIDSTNLEPDHHFIEPPRVDAASASGWSMDLLVAVMGADELETPSLQTRSCQIRSSWLVEEDEIIRRYALSSTTNSWPALACKELPGRTRSAVRNRWLRLSQGTESDPLDENDGCGGVCLGSWTREEDKLIIETVESLGKRWRAVASRLNGRSEQAVRNRFYRLVRCPASLGSWSKTEDAFIVSGVRAFGYKWALIAQRLPERTPDAIRNRFKRLQRAVADGPPSPTPLNACASTA